MMGIFWVANLALFAISVVIFVAIIVSYVKSYRAANARMFSGIIAFSAILLMQSVVSIVVYYTISLQFGSGLAMMLLAINALSLIGYITLYRVLTV